MQRESRRALARNPRLLDNHHPQRAGHLDAMPFEIGDARLALCQHPIRKIQQRHHGVVHTRAALECAYPGRIQPGQQSRDIHAITSHIPQSAPGGKRALTSAAAHRAHILCSCPLHNGAI